MKPVLFIGDTQQANPQRAFLTALEAQYPEHEYWFLGDTLDSFTSKPVEQVMTLRRILELIEAKRARCVWSNHDAQYAFPDLNGSCSGWNSSTAAMVCTGPMAERMRKAFEPYIWEGDVLVTHAGISGKWLASNYLEVADICPQKLTEMFYDHDSPYWHVGRSRGGWNKVGGPLWCDWDEEFVPPDPWVQVVGHTHRRDGKIEYKGDSGGGAINVDTLGHVLAGEPEKLLEWDAKSREAGLPQFEQVDLKVRG